MFENEPGKPEFPVLRPGLDFKDFVGPESRVFGHVPATLLSAWFFHWLVSWSVGWSGTHYFFYDLISLTSLLLPKWSNMAPAYPHATWVALYPALIFDHLAMLDQKNSTQTWSTDWLTKQPT